MSHAPVNEGSEPLPDMAANDRAEIAREDTRRWVDKAVIGLNLCPFAKAVQVKGQVRYVVSQAESEQPLLKELARELLYLADADPDETDTTLLIIPELFADFLDFNDFLAQADDLLQQLGLDGVLQVADFHPKYQFAGTDEDDISNFTNRTPYPTLHLLREDSIDRAVAVFPEADVIFERNIEVLEKLGLDGWRQLGVGATVVEEKKAAK